MRCEHWPRRLNDYIVAIQDRYRETGLRYGELDCCIFVADWCEILTGEDPLADYRGCYTSEAEAQEFLTAEGGLYEALRKRFGEPVHPTKAQRGDIAYTAGGLGIFFTSGAKMRAFFLGKGGFAVHRTQEIEHAFPVR